MKRFIGRPRKFPDGFINSTKRIYVSNDTFERWRTLRSEKNLLTDDILARYLLDEYKQRKTQKGQYGRLTYL